jgi:hypothetical protein
MEDFINAIAEKSGIDKDLINKHFVLFLEKINPDAPVDLGFLEKEFIKALIEIKKEQDGLSKQP